MANLYYFLIFVLTTSKCLATRDLYKIKDGGENNMYGDIVLAIPDSGQGNSNFFNITERFLEFEWKYFGEEKLNHIYVHYNGFIVFDENTYNEFKDNPNQCQRPPNTNENILSVYWAKYDSGAVHAFRHESDGPKRLSDVSLEQIAKDITITFNTPAEDNVVKIRPAVTKENIKDVMVITWNNMFANVDTKTKQKRRHIFQALLIRVKYDGDDKIYQFVQYYYGLLGSNGNWNPKKTTDAQPCQRAESGVSVRSQIFDSAEKDGPGDFTAGFDLPSVLEVTSNENSYEDLGSWTFDVSDSDVQFQPVPLATDCNEKPLDIKCYLYNYASRTKKSEKCRRNKQTPKGASTTSPLQKCPVVTITEEMKNFANHFCKYRDAGLYPIPIICDVYVSCSIGGEATPLVCPEDTNFNPEFLTCDHKDNFECFFGDTDLSNITNVVAPEPNHRNKCHYLGFGEYVDPLSCDHFYACTNSRSILMSCPAGLNFKPVSDRAGYCDWPRNVNCVGMGKRPKPNFDAESSPSLEEQKLYHPRNIN